MRQLVYLAAARDDLLAIQRHINAAAGLEIAEAFVARLRSRCRRLAELPGILGTARTELGADVRSTSYESYVIFFRYRGETVEIINILHASRDIAGYFGDF